MQRYENTSCLIYRHNGYTAVAYCPAYSQGKRGELEIMIYRDGHRQEAVAVCVKGGKLPTAACATSLTLLHTLLVSAMQKWRDLTITFDCPDARRARVYAAMLRRHHITFNQAGSFFELL